MNAAKEERRRDAENAEDSEMNKKVLRASAAILPLLLLLPYRKSGSRKPGAGCSLLVPFLKPETWSLEPAANKEPP